MDLSRSYAAEALGWDYGVQSEHVIATMAAYMDEAWFAAAAEFLRLNDVWLRSVAEYPRECWCGRWPPLGTGCHYHGPCTCLVRADDYYGTDRRWKPKTSYIHGPPEDPVIPLPGDCPVHPAHQVPAEHAVRLAEHLRYHERDRFIPYGRPEPTAAGSPAAAGTVTATE